MRARIWVVLALLLLAGLPLALRGQSGAGLRGYLPWIANATDEAARRLRTPPGFRITTFAEGLSGRPRQMAVGPDGQLYVALMSSGQIARLPDRNRDGRSEQMEIVARDLSLPHSLEWHAGWWYVAEGDRVERLRDADGDGTLETRVLVTDNIPAPVGHSSRTLHIGPDGKLYVSAGSSCNICVEDDPRRAAILRFNLDGSLPTDNPFASDPRPQRRAVWAEGLRNSVDFLWLPDGRLWANHNGSDGLGDDLPPEEIVIEVTPGQHYGWPFCYTPTLGVTPAGTREVRDERITPPTADFCAQVSPARFTDLAHSAPLGMSLAADSGFPADYADDLYVAYHGSWNTDDPANYRDCKVQRIELEAGQPVRSVDFVTGWRAPGQKCGQAWGRPADVLFGADGAMYISDDHGGRIYRVVAVGP